MANDLHATPPGGACPNCGCGLVDVYENEDGDYVAICSDCEALRFMWSRDYFKPGTMH